MLETKRLLARLAKKFPKRLLIKNHDFGGLMCGKLPSKVQTIYLALDMDESLIDDVLLINPDLVITHHPFIYGRKHLVLKNDSYKLALVEKLEAKRIPVYSYHTNFDEGIDGMNDALAEALNLVDIKPLELLPMARGGFLKTPLMIEEFALYAKKQLKVDYGLLLPFGKKEIRSVAIIGGGGARFIDLAMKEGYDLYISGDAPHHVRRHILNRKYSYLDLPHEIENIFIPQMKKLLLEIDPTLKIIEAPYQKNAQVI